MNSETSAKYGSKISARHQSGRVDTSAELIELSISAEAYQELHLAASMIIHFTSVPDLNDCAISLISEHAVRNYYHPNTTRLEPWQPQAYFEFHEKILTVVVGIAMISL